MSILSELQTKKLGLFELLAMGFNLYLKYFLDFFSLLCIALLPFSSIYVFLLLSFTSNFSFLIPFWLFYIFYFFAVIPIYTIAFAILTEGYVRGEKRQLNIVIRGILYRIVPFIELSFTYGLTMMFMFLLLIVQGIIYLVNNAYCLLAFVLRDQKGKAAFQYSRSLVRGNWWKVFFFQVLIFIITFGLQSLTTKFLGMIIASSPILVAILSNVLASIVSLGVGISGVLLFLNLEFQNR